MDVAAILHFLILLTGFYMAWNIGANDVSNAIGTSVGSGALTLKRAVIIAAVFEFCGAFFVGGNVSETMQKGLIDTSLFAAEPLILVLGFCSALLGTSIWLQIASYFGWPVSTTHAVVGSIIGFGAVVGGVDAVRYDEVSSIATSWVLSPVTSGLLAYSLFTLLQRKILFMMRPAEAAKKIFPWLIFVVLSTFTLSLIFNGLKNIQLKLNFFHAFLIALSIGAIGAILCRLLIQKLPYLPKEPVSPGKVTPQTVISLEKACKHLQRVKLGADGDVYERASTLLEQTRQMTNELRSVTKVHQKTSEYRTVERMFVYLQIASACFIAFAHGANDVANAIGPVAAVLAILKNGTISETAPIPTWLLAMGGLGIVIGLATWGWRVVKTIGKKITELTPTRGFCAEFGAATTILVASKFGLPISTTHCLVGGVLGVGLAGGLRALNLSTLREIVLSWIITLPASAAMAIAIFYALRYFLF